jgi:hypothetical protein
VVEVRGQINANHDLERMWIVISKDDEDRNGYGPLHLLAQQFTDANRVQTVAA